MKHTGFKMILKKGFEAEYKKRHDEIWPELSKAIADAGIVNYTIFLDEETNALYAYHEIKGNSAANDLGKLDIVKKWWAYMADIMETNPDNSPVSIPLKEVFHMD